MFSMRQSVSAVILEQVEQDKSEVADRDHLLCGMEATEHSRFVGITIEWKDALGPTGEKTSPESLQISVTAPFEQVSIL
jgi:hypothetical protein